MKAEDQIKMQEILKSLNSLMDVYIKKVQSEDCIEAYNNLNAKIDEYDLIRNKYKKEDFPEPLWNDMVSYCERSIQLPDLVIPSSMFLF